MTAAANQSILKWITTGHWKSTMMDSIWVWLTVAGRPVGQSPLLSKLLLLAWQANQSKAKSSTAGVNIGTGTSYRSLVSLNDWLTGWLPFHLASRWGALVIGNEESKTFAPFTNDDDDDDDDNTFLKINPNAQRNAASIPFACARRGMGNQD